MSETKCFHADYIKEFHRANTAEAELACYKSKYHNLLAVAHRDGGHYLAQHGEEKAGEDAITAILIAYHSNDRNCKHDLAAEQIEALEHDVVEARKLVAQEIVDMLRADRWAESELKDIIEKFGLEG